MYETSSGSRRGTKLQKHDIKMGASKQRELPQGWIKAWKCRKSYPEKSDPLYIDPVSGYVFFSLCDAFRYLDTGDVRYCRSRAWKPDFNQLFTIKAKKPGSIVGLTVEESRTLSALSAKAVNKADVAESPRTSSNIESKTSAQLEADSRITDEENPSMLTDDKSHGMPVIASEVHEKVEDVKREDEIVLTEEVNLTLVADDKELLAIVPASISDDQCLSLESDKKSCEKLQVAETHELLQSENADLSARKENSAVELEKKELSNSSDDLKQLDVVPVVVKDENILPLQSEITSPVTEGVELLHPDKENLSAGKVKLEIEQENYDVPSSVNDYNQLITVAANEAGVKSQSVVSVQNEASQITSSDSKNAKLLQPKKEDQSSETGNLVVLDNVEPSQSNKEKSLANEVTTMELDYGQSQKKKGGRAPVSKKNKLELNGKEGPQPKKARARLVSVKNENISPMVLYPKLFEPFEVTSAVSESVQPLFPANEDAISGKVKMEQDSKEEPTLKNDSEKLATVTAGIADTESSHVTSYQNLQKPLEIASVGVENEKKLELGKECMSSEMVSSTAQLDNIELSQSKNNRRGLTPGPRKKKLGRDDDKDRRMEITLVSEKNKPQLNGNVELQKKKPRGNASLNQVKPMPDGEQEPKTKKPRIQRPLRPKPNQSVMEMSLCEHGYFRGPGDAVPTFFTSPFGNYWLDPCMEFAVKILLGDIQISQSIAGKQQLNSTTCSSLNDKTAVTENKVKVDKPRSLGQNENAHLSPRNDLLWSIRDKGWKTRFLGK